MRHPDYPFWSLVALTLVVLPAPWHLRARNIATLSLIFWLMLANLSAFINTIVWADNYADNSPIWCDISSRILLLVNFALPACSLAQMRRLESVASSRRSVVSPRDRKRRIIEEVVVCLISPIILCALFTIVQGHRYDIIENVGCVTPTYMSVPALIIRFILPAVVALGSLIFAILSVRWFLIRRLQFQTILATSNSNLSVSRYLRLIALAVSDSTILLAYVIYNLTSSNNDSLKAYVSWAHVHENFSQFVQYPEESIGPTYPAFVANIYAPVIYSIVFFTFFGFGEEAINEYLRLGGWLLSVLRAVGLRRSSCSSGHENSHIALGSKVVSALAEDQLYETKSRASATEDAVANKLPFSPTLPRQGSGSSQRGVAVTVEQSVV